MSEDDGAPVYIDEHHQRIAEFAAEFLEEDERDEFVDEMLERRGYQRVTNWAAPPPPDPGARGQGRRSALPPRRQGQPRSSGRTGGSRQSGGGSYWGR